MANLRTLALQYCFAVACAIGSVYFLDTVSKIIAVRILGDENRLSSSLKELLDLRRFAPIKFYIQNTVRYEAIGPEGAEDFAALLPASGHLVHLSGEDTNNGGTGTYTVAMFHQLRCLEILRNDYDSGNQSPYRLHCINYLRQTVLCLADVRLESERSPRAPTRVSLESDYLCRDWRKLYEKAEQLT
ncbi:hypothetical protein EIP91_011916 [Steccherinum ochraceum]|uniref:Uncharacterized protein n=1 Tax=Steccherinum ochraceum TaxID=92696 RepID=A0A4R0RVC9_9APHY|nr:hypothetical protein EIP91_011916 [Steccherinum ochraceum]